MLSLQKYKQVLSKTSIWEHIFIVDWALMTTASLLVNFWYSCTIVLVYPSLSMQYFCIAFIGWFTPLALTNCFSLSYLFKQSKSVMFSPPLSKPFLNTALFILSKQNWLYFYEQVPWDLWKVELQWYDSDFLSLTTTAKPCPRDVTLHAVAF